MQEKELDKQHGLHQYQYTLLPCATIFLMEKTCNSTIQNEEEASWSQKSHHHKALTSI
jgi:hypothetical protein